MHRSKIRTFIYKINGTNVPLIISLLSNFVLIYFIGFHSQKLVDEQISIKEKEIFSLIDKNNILSNENKKQSTEIDRQSNEIRYYKRKATTGEKNRKTYVLKKQYDSDVYRVGAICRDGSKSKATGSGACSWHGGVDCWIYSDGSCRNR